MKKIIDALLHLIFPQLCMHCNEETRSSVKLFCNQCISHLTLEDLKSRCPFCFTHAENTCLACQNAHTRVLAAVSYFGPAKTIIEQLHQGRYKFAKDAAALMAAQYLNEELGLPDIIVPLPEQILPSITRGYSVNDLLAKEVAKILGAEVLKITDSKPKLDWIDKHVVLVGDVLYQDKTYLEIASHLKSGASQTLTSLFFAVNF